MVPEAVRVLCCRRLPWYQRTLPPLRGPPPASLGQACPFVGTETGSQAATPKTPPAAPGCACVCVVSGKQRAYDQRKSHMEWQTQHAAHSTRHTHPHAHEQSGLDPRMQLHKTACVRGACSTYCDRKARREAEGRVLLEETSQREDAEWCHHEVASR